MVRVGRFFFAIRRRRLHTGGLWGKIRRDPEMLGRKVGTMHRCKAHPGALRSGRLMAVLALIAALAAVLGLQQRADAEGNEWKNVQMVFTTDVKGKIEPCG